MIALFIGDFKSEEFIKQVNKYYGAPPSGNLLPVPSFEINPPYSKEIHYLEHDTDVTNVHCVFPAPHFSEPDYYAVDMLAQLLDSGESSPLYKALTKDDDPLVNDMSFYLDSNNDFSLLHFTATLNNPENVQRVVTSVSSFLSNLAQWPFDKKQLKRIVTKNKTEEIYLEEKLHYYGIIQAPMLVNFGYEFIRSYIDRLSQVKPSDISQACDKWFNEKKYLAMAVVPPKAEEN
jgi:predicted Zn-dependent peptidase